MKYFGKQMVTGYSYGKLWVRFQDEGAPPNPLISRKKWQFSQPEIRTTYREALLKAWFEKPAAGETPSIDKAEVPFCWSLKSPRIFQTTGYLVILLKGKKYVFVGLRL